MRHPPGGVALAGLLCAHSPICCLLPLHRVKSCVQPSADRTGREPVDALVDMLMLAKSKRFLGSPASSFSEVAALIGMHRVQQSSSSLSLANHTAASEEEEVVLFEKLHGLNGLDGLNHTASAHHWL